MMTVRELYTALEHFPAETPCVLYFERSGLTVPLARIVADPGRVADQITLILLVGDYERSSGRIPVVTDPSVP